MFIAALIHKNARDKKEDFKNAITSSVSENKELTTIKNKDEIPVKKCEVDETSKTKITKSELVNIEYLFNVFFRIKGVEVREIIKENCFENIFDVINSSYNYQNLNDTEQEVNNWRIKNGLMNKISDLYHIYNFSIENVNMIINKFDKDFNDVVNSNFVISEYGIDSIQKLSVDYFIGSKKFSEKQFKILEFLNILMKEKKKNNKKYKNNPELEKDLELQKSQKLKRLISKIKQLEPLELYYKQEIKDLCSMMVCFEHYGIIKTNDLMTPFPDDDLSGDNWVVQTLEQVKLDDFGIVNEPIFRKYNLIDKITEKLVSIEKTREEEVKSKLIDFSKPGSLLFEQLNNTDSFEVNREIQNREIDEYQKLIVNKTSKESEESKKALNELNDIETIRSKTLGTFNNIVDDIRKLMAEVGEYENFNTGKNNKNDASSTLKHYFEKYIMFFKGFINILVKEQRAFFVGIILIVLSVITNFIEVSKN